MEQTEKTIRIAVEAKTSIPYKMLEPFQGDLKTLPKEQYEKLRKNIQDFGFSFSVHVWQNEGHNYIIDGHQRVFTVSQMAEIDGYTVPDLPVSLVQANTFAEAKKKVLAGASQYGQVSDQGLLQFLQENDIPLDEIVANFEFPEIEFGEFAEKFSLVDKIEEIPPVEPGAEGAPEMKSGSSHVKQVQLFFNDTSHVEFMTKIEELSKFFGKENITDTALEVVRESYQSHFSAPQ